MKEDKDFHWSCIQASLQNPKLYGVSVALETAPMQWLHGQLDIARTGIPQGQGTKTGPLDHGKLARSQQWQLPEEFRLALATTKLSMSCFFFFCFGSFSSLSC